MTNQMTRERFVQRSSSKPRVPEIMYKYQYTRFGLTGPVTSINDIR